MQIQSVSVYIDLLPRLINILLDLFMTQLRKYIDVIWQIFKSVYTNIYVYIGKQSDTDTIDMYLESKQICCKYPKP